MSNDSVAGSGALNKPVVIIGAGHAGLTLAREIRLNCKLTPITIISHASIRAYYKPNLSKALSMGKTAGQLVMKEAEAIAEDLDVTLLEGTTVTSIDAKHKVVAGVTGHASAPFELAYGSLVLATGASPVQLPIERDSTVELLSVNSLENYEDFRMRLLNKKKVLIIGAGFVGCELASDLITSGYQVEVADLAEWPLQRAMPEVMGTEIRKAMAEQGVKWHLGLTLDSVSRRSEHTYRVRFSNDTEIETEVILSAVGLLPNVSLAKEAGILVGRGVVVDGLSETSQKDIYAVGDCVEYQGAPLPFIAPATHAAKALAKTLTGSKTRLELPAMPVVVKIAACPTVICPSLDKKGIWQVRGAGMDLEAHFINEEGNLSGFSLTGQCISKKTQLASECSPTISQTSGIHTSHEAVA